MYLLSIKESGEKSVDVGNNILDVSEEGIRGRRRETAGRGENPKEKVGKTREIYLMEKRRK